MTKNYDNLDFTQVWLEPHATLNKIEGRFTDFGRIGLALEDAVKKLYPVNQVPEGIVQELGEVYHALVHAQSRLDSFINLVSIDVKNNGKNPG